MAIFTHNGKNKPHSSAIIAHTSMYKIRRIIVYDGN